MFNISKALILVIGEDFVCEKDKSEEKRKDKRSNIVLAPRKTYKNISPCKKY